MLLDELGTPIVLAPLAGGPSTPELAAAVSGAGGLGFLAGGYLPVGELMEGIRALRELTPGPFGVGLFCPGAGPADPSAYAGYLQELRTWAARAGAELGEPRYGDDDWAAKVDALCAEPVRAVSFTFGCPSTDTVDRLHAAGSEAWVTVTAPAEARQAEAAGADVLIVQGAEAGGHRGVFEDGPDVFAFGLLPLLALVGEATSLPLVAAGGLATGEAITAVLAAGARAAQLGTAFLLTPEAGTSPAHREAIRSERPTVMTRAFTGRAARGIANAFIAEHEAHAAWAYPELHYVTAPMRRRAREEGDAERINLWAGEAHALARERPAAELVHDLTVEAQRALAAAGQRLGRSDPSG